MSSFFGGSSHKMSERSVPSYTSGLYSVHVASRLQPWPRVSTHVPPHGNAIKRFECLNRRGFAVLHAIVDYTQILPKPKPPSESVLEGEKGGGITVQW